MALPTPSKSWQLEVNQFLDRIGGDDEVSMHKRVMLAIKDSLCGFAAGAWAVRGSSNAVAAGLDDVDRWTTIADIVRGDGALARSWIVLRQPALGMEVCLAFDGTTGNKVFVITAAISLAGFTGGSLTARPTATDEQILLTNTDSWYANVLADRDAWVHVWQSTDGENTMVCAVTSGPPRDLELLWVFGKAAKPVDAWATPQFGVMRGSGGSSSNLQVERVFAYGTPDRVKSWHAGAGMDMRGVMRITRHATAGINGPGWLHDAQAGLHGMLGEAPFWTVGLWGSTAGKRGYHGHIPDLWTGLSSHAAGTGYPGDGSRQFMKLGDYIFPWNGSTLA